MSYQQLPTTPARKIRPTRRSVSGMVALGNGTFVEYESTLERDFVIRQAFDCRVERILQQPLTLQYTASNGRRYDYTPDFLVTFKADEGGLCPPPLLVEVKSQKELDKDWAALRPKFREAVRYAKAHGFRFSIRNEERIYGQMLENIYFLRRFRKLEVSEEQSDRLLQALDGLLPTQIRVLMHKIPESLFGPTGAAVHLWHLVAAQRLGCDMHEPLSDHSVVWRKTR